MSPGGFEYERHDLISTLKATLALSRDWEMGQDATDVAQVRPAGGFVHGTYRKGCEKGPGLGCILG